MIRIGARGAAVVVLGVAVLGPGSAVAQEETSGLLEAICDELGPDTTVYSESATDDSRPTPVVAGIDMTRLDPATGRYLSHERVFDRRLPVSVDEVCTFEMRDGAGSVTLGLLTEEPSTAP